MPKTIARIRLPDILPANLQLALAGFGGANCTGNVPGSAANGCFFFNPFSTGVDVNVVTGQRNLPRGMGGTFDPDDGQQSRSGRLHLRHAGLG